MYQDAFTKCSWGYTLLPNSVLRDPRLRLQDKGLLAMMLSLPPSWQFSIAGLTAICLESTGCVRASLKRLEEAGWLSRRRSRTRTGCFDAVSYYIAEPKLLSRDKNPTLDNRLQLNKDYRGVREQTRTPAKSVQPVVDTGWAEDPEVY